MAQVTVTNRAELQAALHSKVDEITVSKALREFMVTLANRQVSDTARIGFEVGGRGVLTVLEHGLNHVQTLRTKGDKTDARIAEQVLGLYTITLQADGTTALRLKQLDY